MAQRKAVAVAANAAPVTWKSNPNGSVYGTIQKSGVVFRDAKVQATFETFGKKAIAAGYKTPEAKAANEAMTAWLRQQPVVIAQVAAQGFQIEAFSANIYYGKVQFVLSVPKEAPAVDLW